MPRQPIRNVPRGEWSTWEVSAKTHEGRLFLVPDGFTERVLLGLLERCRRAVKGVRIYQVAFQSNHYHVLMGFWSPEAQGSFMNLFQGLAARVINVHLGRHDALWGATYSASRVAPDAEYTRAVYLARQGLGEGLYERAHHNPCANTVRALTEGQPLKGLDIDLGAWQRALNLDPESSHKSFTREVTVQLSPLPSLASLLPKAQEATWRRIVKDAEAEGTALRAKAGIERVLGAAAMRLQDPWSKPKQTKRGRSAPLFHANKRDGKALRHEYMARMVQRQASLERLATGLTTCEFPDSMHIPVELACAARRLEPHQGSPEPPD